MKANAGVRLTADQLVRLLRPAQIARVALASVLHLLELALLAWLALLALTDRQRAAIMAAIGLFVITNARRAVMSGLSRLVRGELFRATVDAMLSTSNLAAEDSESILGLVFDGLRAVELLLCDTLPVGLANLSAVVLLAALLPAVLSGTDALLTAASLAAGAGASIAVANVTTRAASALQEAFDPVLNQLLDAMRGRLETVASGRDLDFRERMDALLRTWRRVGSRAGIVLGLTSRLPLFVAGSILLAGAWPHRWMLATSSQLSGIPALAAFVPAAVGLARGLFELRRHTPMARSLIEFLHGTPWPRGGEPGRSLPALPARVDCEHVSVAYPASVSPAAIAVQDCSFTWRPGEILVLLGPNGSGKSTILRLLLGLIEPSHGNLMVGGIPLFDLSLRHWRHSIVYLPQRPYFPDRATVADIVRMLGDDLDDDRINESLAAVGLLDALRTRSREHLTISVRSLSAGERQRLALARAYCSKAPIVLLDEPDANLDREGIRMVASLIRRWAAARMVAVAAHTPDLAALGDVRVSLERASSGEPLAVGR